MNNIDNIVNQIKQATDFQTNKRILRERILTDLHMPYNNGMFKLTPELLAFAATWPDEEFYLEDTFENPIKINRASFLEQARNHYQKAMNEWHQQHEELKRIRKI